MWWVSLEAREMRSAVEDLGFDACIDHRDPAMKDLLAQSLPEGYRCLF